MKVREILQELEKAPEKKAEFEKDPVKFLERNAGLDPGKHKFIFILVVVILGAALLLSIGGVMSEIKGADDTVNNFFVMIASGAIGALAGLIGHNAN